MKGSRSPVVRKMPAKSDSKRRTTTRVPKKKLEEAVKKVKTEKASSKAGKLLQQVPSLGPRLATGLTELGVYEMNQLCTADPEDLYKKMMTQRGCHVDRCVLYTFRCARYFARTPAAQRQEALLKWWNWSDAKMPADSPLLLGCDVTVLKPRPESAGKIKPLKKEH